MIKRLLALTIYISVIKGGFAQERTVTSKIVSEADGQTQFEKPWDDIDGARPVVRLERVGEYNNTSFRIFHNTVLE